MDLDDLDMDEVTIWKEPDEGVVAIDTGSNERRLDPEAARDLANQIDDRYGREVLKQGDLNEFVRLLRQYARDVE